MGEVIPNTRFDNDAKTRDAMRRRLARRPAKRSTRPGRGVPKLPDPGARRR